MQNQSCPFQEQNFTHYTHCDGHFYNKPKKFPVIFHDKNGCFLVPTEEKFSELVKMDIFKISHGKNGEKINVKNCIAKLNGYIRCAYYSQCPRARIRKSGNLKIK